MYMKFSFVFIIPVNKIINQHFPKFNFNKVMSLNLRLYLSRIRGRFASRPPISTAATGHHAGTEVKNSSPPVARTSTVSSHLVPWTVGFQASIWFD